MFHVLQVDRLGWGFVVLGSGLVMLIVDVHKDPRRFQDAFMRTLVIICVAAGSLMIVNETIGHLGLFDEQPMPSVSSLFQSVV